VKKNMHAVTSNVVEHLIRNAETSTAAGNDFLKHLASFDGRKSIDAAADGLISNPPDLLYMCPSKGVVVISGRLVYEKGYPDGVLMRYVPNKSIDQILIIRIAMASGYSFGGSFDAYTDPMQAFFKRVNGREGFQGMRRFAAAVAYLESRFEETD